VPEVCRLRALDEAWWHGPGGSRPLQPMRR
jgi:hypothetical protein